MFKNPGYFYWMVLIPVITGIFIWKIIQHNNRFRTAGKAYSSLIHPVSNITAFMKFFFLRNAIAFMIITLAGPVYGSKKVKATKETLELVVCLDISNSMNTRDISKTDSRLEISKRALIQLINNLNGEQLGLVLFANDAFVQLPLTSDYAAAKLFIKDVETSMISNQGTDVAEALRVAADMFSDKKVAKGIIMVTDGEHHEGGVDDAINLLKEKNIQLSVLGIGTEKGGLVPKDPFKPDRGYKTDASGRSVLSKVNRNFIRNLANKAGGYASYSDEEFPDLSPLLTQLKTMKRTKIDILDFDVKQERYRVPLVLSILFWIGYLLWSAEFLRIFRRKETVQ